MFVVGVPLEFASSSATKTQVPARVDTLTLDRFSPVVSLVSQKSKAGIYIKLHRIVAGLKKI